MADEIYNPTPVEASKSGMFMDCDPLNQPKGTRRFTLNGIEQSEDGKNKINNELSNVACTNFTEGFHLIGDEYIGDNTSVVILTNPSTGIDEIGIVDKSGKYNVIVNTGVLQLKIANQCEIIYRLRRGKERVIYWVDGNSNARTLNLDRLHNFYSVAYQNYIKQGGDPNAFIGEKWSKTAFELIKSFSSIPFFNKVEVIETGGVLPGSYNFAIQYVDEDLNPTVWTTTSNTVNIYNDSVTNPYERIRGSRNVNTASQSWGRTNKSIKLTIGNLDTSFPYYRVAIIRAAGNSGSSDKVFVSDLYSIDNSIFQYSGNDSALKEIALADILIDKEVIFSPKHIEQQDNRLILANGKVKSVNWCELQKYASKIKTDLVTSQVVLNSVDSDGNVKSPNSTFILSGYMPGEVASFGIVWVFDDGYISPNFHIPGRNVLDTNSKMTYYEIDTTYLDIHNCSTDNYWGVDAMGKTLVGKNIRHHRFPFRKDVNKPVVTSTNSTTNIIKYRLKLVISLNPSFTPSPNTYPVDGSNNPLLIDYTINYQVTGEGTTKSFNGELTDTIVANGTEIIIYDDSNTLDQITGSYIQLDSTSQLATYQITGNEKFILTPTYESYTLSSVINSDVAEVFGISFSNIEKPREDIVGFFIVRNEQTDDDTLIVDNAIIGATLESQQYVSFGLVNPKQFYNTNNCGLGGSNSKPLVYNNETFWFFNPRYEFLGAKPEFDSILVEGKYNETSVNMPTISDTDGSACNGGYGGTKGVYIQDVQAGTSYNPDVNKSKNKDDDGFDLIIGYRNTNVNFAIDVNNLTLPIKDKIIYLNAASYQNFGDKTYYNVSVDNRIGLFLGSSTFDTNELYNTTTKQNSLIYASLVKNNTSAYSNFMSRPYFKEHNNPVLFEGLNIVNDFRVFNGDARISATNIVSSVFYDMVVADRPKKSRVWQIIVGAILVVAAVAITVVSAGTGSVLGVSIGTAGVTAISAAALSYGVSLAMSGIKFEQMKAMIDTDYEKGLVDTVTDGGVYETVRKDLHSRGVYNTDDDTIRWFTDRVSNVYIESRVPMGLRSGLTSGVTDFTDSPCQFNELEFRSYLTEKMTTVDRDQGSGRLYKGYAGAEVYDINLDYMRKNKEKEFFHLPIEYDCCSDVNEIFPNRRWYSEQSFQEEKTDNYKVFLPNNYSDIEGESGEITGMYALGVNLYMHTEESLWEQPANLQERVTNEVVSFIGTGDFLSVPPRKVLDSSLGSAGTQHKWATLKTEYGVISVSELENTIYIHLMGANMYSRSTISYLDSGMNAEFQNNLKSFLSKQVFELFGIPFLNNNNPANPNGIGYLSAYDKKFERAIFTKRDYLILPEKVAQISLVNSVPIDGNAFVYCSANGLFYQGVTVIDLDNNDYFENKSYTISFSFKNNKWISWHSYLPNYYITMKGSFYSHAIGSNSLWRHNNEGNYGNFYGKQYPFIVEIVALSRPLEDQILEDITIQTNARQWDSTNKHYINNRYTTFNKLQLYNNIQHSGELEMIVKETQDNPENWYSQQTVNKPGQILISKSGENWNINGFRNYIVDYSKPMFSSSWVNIKNGYFIDKVVNSDAINFNKNWWELETFKDKFLVIRLIFDNFNNINLGLNYSIATQEVSE